MCRHRCHWSSRDETDSGAGPPTLPSSPDTRDDRGLMKNTAIGNHAGPVGSITISNRVPAGASEVPLSPARSSSPPSATPCASPAPHPHRSEPAPHAPTRSPNRCQPIVCHSPLPPRCVRHAPTRSRATPTERPRSQGRPNRGSHSCSVNGPDLQRAGPLPSSGASVAGPDVTIRLTRRRRQRRPSALFTTSPPEPAGAHHQTPWSTTARWIPTLNAAYMC